MVVKVYFLQPILKTIFYYISVLYFYHTDTMNLVSVLIWLMLHDQMIIKYKQAQNTMFETYLKKFFNICSIQVSGKGVSDEGFYFTEFAYTVCRTKSPDILPSTIIYPHLLPCWMKLSQPHFSLIWKTDPGPRLGNICWYNTFNIWVFLTTLV